MCVVNAYCAKHFHILDIYYIVQNSKNGLNKKTAYMISSSNGSIISSFAMDFVPCFIEIANNTKHHGSYKIYHQILHGINNTNVQISTINNICISLLCFNYGSCYLRYMNRNLSIIFIYTFSCHINFM